MSKLELTTDDFENIRAYVKDVCGIAVGDEKSYLVETRLSTLAIQEGCESFADFYQKLKSDPRSPLREKVVDAMTTNETLWFRDDGPWTILNKYLLPRFCEELQKGTRHKVRIWSAASSTGQEAYSMAITILDYLRENSSPGVKEESFEILGTDLSPSALFVAISGRYCPFGYTAFWKHCLTTAIAAGTLAERAPRIAHVGRPGENPYFVAGLMHDVGIFMLVQCMGRKYARVLRTAEKNGKPLHEVERELLGFDHGEVGGALIAEWQLPKSVCTAAAYHHSPELAPGELRIFAEVIHLADWIADHEGLGAAIEGDLPRFREGAWFDLGIEVEDIPDVIDDFSRAAERSETLLALTR